MLKYLKGLLTPVNNITNLRTG
uniref:Uncharacterized protein n=1 Tax=Anguilla anguilla TaxID=7936 RepID=A0A0E9RUB0_ANGAN